MDFQPTSEAVEAAANGMETVDSGRTNLYHESWKVLARAAIAAFVEAEGMYIEIAVKARIPLGGAYAEGPAQRLVGQYRPLRKRD